jgi:hypothetical protein
MTLVVLRVQVPGEIKGEHRETVENIPPR